MATGESYKADTELGPRGDGESYKADTELGPRGDRLKLQLTHTVAGTTWRQASW